MTGLKTPTIYLPIYPSIYLEMTGLKIPTIYLSIYLSIYPPCGIASAV